MNAVYKTSPAFLTTASGVSSLEIYAPTFFAALDNVESPDAHTHATSIAPVDGVGSDEKLLDNAHDSIVRSGEKQLDQTHTSMPETKHEFDIQWSSYEHEYRIRGPYWFLYPLSGATAGIVFGVTTHNYLFVSFVVLSFLMLAYYAKRPPRMLTYAIEKRGVWTSDKLIHYGKLKSFWIFTHALMAPELLLETGNPVNSLIHIRLEGVDYNEVRTAISRYLPEKEQKDLASHQITRIIGF